MKKIEAARSAKGCDLLLFTSQPSLQYFFNYGGQSFERFSCGIISMHSGKSALVIPKLDEPKSRESSAGGVHAWRDSEGYLEALQKALNEVGTGKRGAGPKIGCEANLAYWQMKALEKALPTPTLESITEDISKLRACKDEEEVSAILGAGGILSNGFRAVAEGLLEIGMSEREASFEIKKVLFDSGAAHVDFCAVQSGPNSAVPHLETTSRTIQRSDAVLIDISMRNEAGYFADFTRTFVAGDSSQELRKVHALVEEAQKAGVRKAREPGATAEGVDGAARKVIARSGMEDLFFHRTGHGIGLEVHELPWITSGNQAHLRKGMAFTVEPGIYIEGKFGVRIEDNVIIGPHGPIVIPELSKDLISI